MLAYLLACLLNPLVNVSLSRKKQGGWEKTKTQRESGGGGGGGQGRGERGGERQTERQREGGREREMKREGGRIERERNWAFFISFGVNMGSDSIS